MSLQFRQKVMGTFVFFSNKTFGAKNVPSHPQILKLMAEFFRPCKKFPIVQYIIICFSLLKEKN